MEHLIQLCISATIVNKSSIQKKTCSNMWRFTQMWKETEKLLKDEKKPQNNNQNSNNLRFYKLKKIV